MQRCSRHCFLPNQTSSCRKNIISLACKYGHPKCTFEARQLFGKWVADPRFYIAPILRKLVYKHGIIAVSTPAVWEVMLECYLAETDAQVLRIHFAVFPLQFSYICLLFSLVVQHIFVLFLLQEKKKLLYGLAQVQEPKVLSRFESS